MEAYISKVHLSNTPVSSKEKGQWLRYWLLNPVSVIDVAHEFKRDKDLISKHIRKVTGLSTLKGALFVTNDGVIETGRRR